MWHVICGIFCVAGMISYAFMGCEESEKTLNIRRDAKPDSCDSDCHCDFVKFSPVCGDDGLTYTSACHAGCKSYSQTNSSKAFGNCSCINSGDDQNLLSTFSWNTADAPKTATPGQCEVNCQRELVFFLAVMCFLKFIGATGRTSNFLVSIRCIDEKDKTVAIGIGGSLIHLFAFIPSPILFGFILDK
jgi:Organic Anion Transporter Polypeptide (OATP) family/Kazal-type serine protease inhibitor domain